MTAGRIRILYAGDCPERQPLLVGLGGISDLLQVPDGEAAWQKLVIDPGIQGLLLEQDLQCLSLDDLMQRLQSSKLARLRELPTLMFAQEDPEEEGLRARAWGVAECVSPDLPAKALLDKLKHWLVQAASAMPAPAEALIHDPVSGLYSARYAELQAAQALSHAARHGGEVSGLVLGFDQWDDVSRRLGLEKAQQIVVKFAKMLAGKMRQEDTLGQFAEGQFVIVSPGTSSILCQSFAGRVREAVESARIAVQGQPCTLTVSVGVASVPSDPVTSAGALLKLAADRMRQAQQAGGNQVLAAQPGVSSVKVLTLAKAMAHIAAGQAERVRPHLPALAEELLPLLRLMQDDFGVDLALPDIEQVLRDRHK